MLYVLLSKHTLLEILPAYSLKSSNLFNFREGRKKGRGGANMGAPFHKQVTLRHWLYNVHVVQCICCTMYIVHVCNVHAEQKKFVSRAKRA